MEEHRTATQRQPERLTSPSQQRQPPRLRNDRPAQADRETEPDAPVDPDAPADDEVHGVRIYPRFGHKAFSTLWVGNIPVNATNRDLQNLVGDAGSCKIVYTDRGREAGRLHGFINLNSPEAAARVKTAIEGLKLCDSELGLEVRPKSQNGGGFRPTW